VAAPAELPPALLALKRQQFRWAKGSFQVLGKLGPELLRAPLPLFRKALGLLHLAGYLPHPLMVLSLLLSLPLVMWTGRAPIHWEALSWLGLVPPLVTLWGQLHLRRAEGWRSLAYYPVMALGMIGLALNNTCAFVEACLGIDSDFKRTPKFSAHSAGEVRYTLPLDWTTAGEIGLAAYALVTGLLALAHLPGLAPVMLLYALAFGYTAALGLWESSRLPQTRTVSEAGTD
jgi:cellulose synthase/poly-beta-1,6-N-acetylglucosamine synthase-like glycosyltransferase